jgi:Cys-tRNA(Pro) deacylase
MLSPEDVQAALDKLGCNIQVTRYETSTATSQEAADSIGTELGSIVKSLCFLVDGQPVVVLAAGDQRMDERKIAQLYEVGKKKVRMADAEKTIEVTGYAPGGVPPVGHVQELPILIDKTLERFELVYAAAGAPNAIFPIKLEQLIEITGGKVADIARDMDAGVSL